MSEFDAVCKICGEPFHEFLVDSSVGSVCEDCSDRYDDDDVDFPDTEILDDL